MATELPQRLAAILAADIAGYTRLMEADEAGMVDAWRRAREQIIDPTIARCRGRIVKLTGDGFLAEFSTVESAVRAALDMQSAFAGLFAEMPAARRVAFRMGVNVGDIWVDAEDIYGAGVNVAARLEGLAEPGGVCISGAVYDAVKHKIAARYVPMGAQSVKHVAEPIQVWRVREAAPGAATAAKAAARWRPTRREWLGAGVALAGAAALGAVLVRGRHNGTPRTLAAPPGALRLAVLPFRNLSGDAAQDYMSEGVTDEMIAELGRLQPERLSVIARTSVMRYKDSAEPASAIGHELGVDYVLEGSVLREGDVIRVIPRLIDARNDTRVWDAPFERRLSGVLALQRDVARGIADSLALALLPEEATRLATAREIDPDAYDEYLKGRSLWYRITPRDSDAALAHFERALERAPDSALMHAWLAIAHASRAQLSVVRTVDAYAAAKPAAEKALSLDPGLPEAHFAAAIVHTWEEWDWAAAEREFEKALALNASYADARAAYSHYLTIVGRSAESAEQIERAMALDPFNPLHRSFYAIVLAAARRTDEAVAIAREVLQTVPNNPVANTALTESLRLLGRSDEELAQWRGYFAQVGDAEMEVALERGAAAGGYTAAAREAAALLDARSRVTDVPPVFVAGWHLRAGDTDGALAWLERALEARDQNLPYVNSVQHGIRCATIRASRACCGG